MCTPRFGTISPSPLAFSHKLRRVIPAWVGAAAFCLAALPGCAQATATLLATQSSLAIRGLSTPQGIALDPTSGVLYIADPANNDVLQVAKDGTVSVYPTLALNAPQGVAIGPDETLYIADTGDNRIVKGSGVLTYTNGVINQPTGITVDSQENVYIANSGNSTVVEVPNSLLGTQRRIPTSGLSNPTSVAIDTNGDLFIADTGNNRVVEVYANAGVPASGSQTTLATTGLGTASGVGIDNTGNLFITDSVNNQVLEIPASGGVPASGTQTTVYTTGLSQPQGVVADSSGNIYISDMGHSRVVVENVQSNRNLGVASVGGFGDPMILNYSIAGYSGSSYVPKMQMNFGKNMSLGALNCSGGTAPEICSIPVTLQPAAPGALADAVNVLDPTTQAILTQTQVYGTAQGPLSVFEPGTATVLPVTGLIDPVGLAVDGSGNLFIADAGPAQNSSGTSTPGDVVEFSAAGVQSTLTTTGVVAPYGVAVDGSGNIYVADYGNAVVYGNVLEIAPSGVENMLTPSNTLYLDPTDVVVDTVGNLFTADYGNLEVIMTPANGGAVTKPITFPNIDSPNQGPQISNSYTPPYVQPLTVAVDGADNLYVADTYNNQIVMGPANTSTAPTVLLASTVPIGGETLNFPSGIAVDAAGTVYVADSGNNRIVEIPAGGGAPTVLNVTAAGVALNNQAGLALDSMGNLYIADSTGTGTGRVVKVTRSSQSLAFPTTNDGVPSAQQIVSLINAGNQTLTLSALTVTPNFTLGGAATSCTSSTTLAAGAQCGLGVEFDPTTSGALTGTVDLTDDNLNAPGNAAQQISLSGTGTGFAATIALTETPGSTVTVGTAVTVTATLTGSNGTPSGNITYTIDGLNPQTVALDGTGAAQFTVPGTLTVGSHNVIVSYAGDADYSTATPSQSFTLVVTAQPGPGATTTALVLTPTSSNFGQSVTLTATVTAGSSGTPTGTVTFYNGTTALGSAVSMTNGVASMTTTTLPIGSDVLTAQYSGDTNFAGSTSPDEVETVTGAVATTTALALSPSFSNQGQSVTLTATVTFAGSTFSPTGTVSFFNGTTLLGTAVALTSGTASMTTMQLPVGTDVLTAQYSGDTNFNGSTSSEEIEAVAGLNFTATLSSTSLTLTSTAVSVTDTLTLASAGGYAGTLQFACAGLPAGATCSFSPATQTLTSSSTGIKVTMTVQSSSVAALDRWNPVSPAGNLPGLPMLATAFWMPGWLITALAGTKGKKKSLASQRARHLLLLVLLLGGVGMLTACGGSAASTPAPTSQTPSTPAGTSSAELVITGTGNVSQVIPFTVVVK